MTAPDPQQAAWLVYLNGVQVPCPRVTVSYGVWRIPEATLSFPPHRLLQRLGAEDRLEVTVFYLDTTYDPANPQFRLLFEGEILGWSYSSTPLGRMMTFNAIADISVFQSMYFFFMNTVDSVVGFSAADAGTGAANVIGATGVHYPFSIFTKGLFIKADKDGNAPDIKRPYDLVENVIRGLVSPTPGSEADRADRRPIPCVNFYSRWVRKRNFVNRFVALPLFEDDLTKTDAGVFAILQSVKATSALDAMTTSLAKSVGDQGSVYDLLQKLLGMTYSELAMIPTAPCFVAALDGGAILRTAPRGPSDPQLSDTETLRLVNYFVKPQMLFGVPPSCNLIFPSMVSSYTYTENYWTQPTRTYVNDQFFTAAIKEPNPLTAAALTVGYPEEIDSVMQTRFASGDDAQQTRLTGKNVLVFPEEFYKGPVVNRNPVPAWFTYLANQAAAANKTVPAPGEIPPTTTNLHSLFFLYSQYEHFRSRYEQRGGAVDMIWNPYVLPGFPCYIFDNRNSALDTAGYVMNVQQTLDASGGGSMSTSINYSFGRTINELFDTMKVDMNRLGVVLASAPVDPVDGVRRISQNFTHAEEFYNALLFGRETLDHSKKKASADLRDIVAFVKDRDDLNYNDELVLEDIAITGDETQEVTYLGTDTGGRTRPQTNFGSSSTVAELAEGASRDVEAKPGFEAMFNNGITALNYISRPICTLGEYIAFLHGGLSIAELESAKEVTGPRDEYSYADLVGVGSKTTVVSSARYYERIRRLRPGPGLRPDPAQTGVTIEAAADVGAGSTKNVATPFHGVLKGLPDDFPQTRLDWDAIILAYRQQILDRQSPQR